MSNQLRSSVFALIDCNNFFVSCERLFRPDLEGKPVVVLSSNDGCVVARSNEAKTLGIPMAAPAFKYRELFKREGVRQFSANFDLYGDLSQRIITLLTSVTPRIEVYSVDEAFLDLSQLAIKDYNAWGREVRTHILRYVGIPVSIGIAPTKTLAKLAAAHAKKMSYAPANQTYGEAIAPTGFLAPGTIFSCDAPEQYYSYSSLHFSEINCTWHSSAKDMHKCEGVLSLVNLEKGRLQRTLEVAAVEDIWGIGRGLGPRLRASGVATAADVAAMSPSASRQLLGGVRGEQLVRELRGQSCLPLEQGGKAPKSIAHTRTFGQDTNDLSVLEAAIATFAAQAALRLRRSGQLTRRASLFLTSNKHKPPYQSWHQDIHLPVPTADTGQLIGLLVEVLDRTYNKDVRYHRAGVLLYDFVSSSHLQTVILGQVNVNQHVQATKRMQAIDNINARYGKRRLRYAAESLASAWKPHHNLRSPHYTTNWDELPIIYL